MFNDKDWWNVVSEIFLTSFYISWFALKHFMFVLEIVWVMLSWEKKKIWCVNEEWTSIVGS